MFTTARSLSNLNVPRLKTRKALIVINLQKDTFYQDDDAFNCKNSEFVEEVKNLIPCFRDIGDVVWVQTEIAWPAGSSPRTPSIEDDTTKSPRKDHQTHKDSDQWLDSDRDESQTEENESRPRPAKPVKWKDTQAYHLLSHVKSMEMRASAQASVKQRPVSRKVLNDNTNVWEEQLAKSTRGQEPKFYIAGTSGAELLDDLKDLVDKERDMTVIKQFYSAFDQTSLLMSLRMRLVTEIYICGSFTNIGVYATAVDAVQHGFEVNIVEDCVGYRSADKHDEAMRQMADVLGVNGTDSEEIIAELGGRAPPDTAEPMFSSRDLGSIKLEESSSDTAHSMVAPARGATNRKNAETSKRPPSRHPKAYESLETTATETSGRGIEDIASDVERTKLAAGRRVCDQSGERSPFPGPTASKLKDRKSLLTSSSTLKGPGDKIGTGDSHIIHNILTSPCCEEAFDMVRDEVAWQVMHHRGGEVPRLVAVQGQVENDGTVPLYRHPADESPPLLQFSPAVDSLRKQVERTVKQPLNHALIQLYRDGNDNISEHSDKVGSMIRALNSKQYLTRTDFGHRPWLHHHQPQSWRTTRYDFTNEEAQADS